MNPSGPKPSSRELLRAFEFAVEADDASRQIGDYKLLELLGEGGFGEVWLAEQQQPIRRRVALKIIKVGMDTRELLARFEAERQALALMDHPNIARVFDAGATEAGRPFFVMELVRGRSITQFCAHARLPIEQRIALFIVVCQALQHAHDRGIVHRDLKPANIIVADTDGEPTPKIIDFGVAKAMGALALTDKTLFTRLHTFIGTPLYTSPEQIDANGAAIDARSDIYSLGVLLYELLAGQPPFDPEEFGKASVDAARRMILEREPPPPSQRLNALPPQTRETIAGERRTSAKRLSRQLRAELNWIVLRCLEKNRDRRYDSARALAQDLQRFLRSEPVEARPPSTTHRVRGFARRHRWAVGVAGVVAAIAVLVPAVSRAARTFEARRLAAQAEALFDLPEEPSRGATELAESLLLRAVALDPNNAHIRTLNSRFHLHPHSSNQGSEADRLKWQLIARTEAEVAVKLDPNSFEAQVALARAYLANPTTKEQAARMLRELVARRPKEPLALYSLFGALLGTGRLTEALQVSDQMSAVAPDNPRTWNYRAIVLNTLWRFEEAQAALDRVIALRPSSTTWLLKTKFALAAGDIPGAISMLEHVESSSFLRPGRAYVGVWARLWNGEPEPARAIARAVTDEFVKDAEFCGPWEYLNGLALARANQAVAAETSWRLALHVVEKRGPTDPDAKTILAWKAVLLSRLGEKQAAGEMIAAFRPLMWRDNGWWQSDLRRRVFAAALRIGDRSDTESWISEIRRSNDLVALGAYRSDPEFDDVRDQPWFQELVANEAAVVAEKRAAFASPLF